MNKYPVTLFRDHPETHFEHRVVAHLARVSEAFILKCEQQDLITTRIMLHGRQGVCFADVCKLKMIRHLHEDMGLTLEAVDFVLRYRHQIKRLNRKLNKMKQRIRQKEQEHRTEIQILLQRADLDDT
jgi:hypothetical protein